MGERSTKAAGVSKRIGAIGHTTLASGSDDQFEADRVDLEELQGVPDEQQDEQSEPAWAAVVGDCGADRRSVEVDPGEQHGGDTSLHVAPCMARGYDSPVEISGDASTPAI